MSLTDLPAVNASLNGLSATFLLIGYIMIKRGNRVAHRNCMIGALTASVIFLVSYLTYHSQIPSTRFEEPKAFRPFYLAILLTHTILAVVIVPLVLVSLNRAWKGRFELHRKIARWTWPLWMYVSVTGVVIYLLLYQIYPQNRGESNTQAVAASKQ
jgi:uncharacterized membrane protein YozB (DUF420 family)